MSKRTYDNMSNIHQYDYQYDSVDEPSDADTIHSWSVDSRGSSDLWYISDDGFVSFSLSPEPLPCPEKKRRRILPMVDEKNKDTQEKSIDKEKKNDRQKDKRTKGQKAKKNITQE